MPETTTVRIDRRVRERLRRLEGELGLTTAEALARAIDVLDMELLWRRVESYYAEDPDLSDLTTTPAGSMRSSVRRGEIWLAVLDAPLEAGEPAKTRRALIVSPDRFNRSRAPTVVVVPLTTVARQHPLHVEIDTPGLAGVSCAQTELVGVVSRRRLVHRLGVVDDLVMAQVSMLASTVCRRGRGTWSSMRRGRWC